MAGKQFSFFLGPKDEVAFEKTIRLSGEVAFLKVWPKSPKPEELATSRVLEMGNEILDILIARRIDVPRIKFSRVQGRDVFACDITSAQVIEFGRCYSTDRYIRAGRLYMIDKYWDQNGNLVSKSDAFIDWANRLYQRTKTSLTKVEQGCYAGADALELRKAGVPFEGLDIEVGSIKD